jgi:hypothetical protein
VDRGHTEDGEEIPARVRRQPGGVADALGERSAQALLCRVARALGFADGFTGFLVRFPGCSLLDALPISL